MDIRIESNIGLALLETESIQQSLLKLKDTYKDAPLLMIKCHQSNEVDSNVSILLTLFSEGKTEIMTGTNADPIKLLEHLLNDLIELKWKRDFPFTPIRFKKTFRSAS